jgi:hypothetical protein
MAGISNEQIVLDIAPLRVEDRNRWSVLARSYKTFYETELPDSKYDEIWHRLLITIVERNDLSGFNWLKVLPF